MKGRLTMVSGQILTFVAFFVAWELIVRLLAIKPVILPPPSSVFEMIWEQRALLLKNTWPTFVAISLGFLWAIVFGSAIAIGIAFSRVVREVTYPFLVVAQILPKIAFAPLFLIWFGFGLMPKIVIAALIAFFPIVINMAKGLTSVDGEMLEYMDSLGASAREKFFKISLPWAMPYIFAALKISATASVVGAIIGELPSSIQDGLGGAILNFNQYYSLDPTALWATNIVAAVLGIAFFGVVVLAERLVVRAAPEHVA